MSSSSAHPNPSPPDAQDIDAFAARWAIRQLLNAKQRRDHRLVELYGALAAEHVNRHIAQRRGLP